MIRWLVVAFALLAALVVGGPALLAQIPAARGKVSDALHGKGEKGQSASQLSAAEFARIPRGLTTARLRGLAGAPEDSHRVRVEGLELECLYYGIAATSGSYQFCFSDGRLATKARFAAHRRR